MKDSNIYPTEEELSKIRNWDIIENGIEGLIGFIEERWEFASYGMGFFQWNGMELELHTGGWSGNESIIDALESNHLFWMSYWQASKRGGHYYFKIPMDHTKGGGFK